MLSLTTKYRRELKGLAHTLNPVVSIGKTGLSVSVMDELDRGLSSHELIKVKVQIDNREARNALLEKVCQQLNAAPVQQIGKILVIYRPKPEEKEKLPALSFHKKKNKLRRTKRSFQS